MQAEATFFIYILFIPLSGFPYALYDKVLYEDDPFLPTIGSQTILEVYSSSLNEVIMSLCLSLNIIK